MFVACKYRLPVFPLSSGPPSSNASTRYLQELPELSLPSRGDHCDSRIRITEAACRSGHPGNHPPPTTTTFFFLSHIAFSFPVKENQGHMIWHLGVQLASILCGIHAPVPRKNIIVVLLRIGQFFDVHTLTGDQMYTQPKNPVDLSFYYFPEVGTRGIPYLKSSPWFRPCLE